jgi:hypothetical protein
MRGSAPLARMGGGGNSSAQFGPGLKVFGRRVVIRSEDVETSSGCGCRFGGLRVPNGQPGAMRLNPAQQQLELAELPLAYG